MLRIREQCFTCTADTARRSGRGLNSNIAQVRHLVVLPLVRLATLRLHSLPLVVVVVVVLDRQRLAPHGIDERQRPEPHTGLVLAGVGVAAGTAGALGAPDRPRGAVARFGILGDVEHAAREADANIRTSTHAVRFCVLF